MIPGNPQANMYFTLYGFNTLDQARGLIRDLKMVRVPAAARFDALLIIDRVNIRNSLPELLSLCSRSVLLSYDCLYS